MFNIYVAVGTGVSGLVLMTIPLYSTALYALMIPHPMELFGDDELFAVVRNASRTCTGVNSGRADRIMAATPATSGVAMDVPEGKSYPDVLGTAQYVPTPCAETSGFVLPSLVGPKELNPATVPLLFTAPTEIILSASAGVII